MNDDLLREIELEEAALFQLKHDRVLNTQWTPRQLEYLNGMWHERIISGANQCGKSEVVVAVGAMHLTGRYPQWYKGPRYDRPVRMACAGVTAQSTIELLTDKFFGPLGDRGSGFLRLSDFDNDDFNYVVGGKKGQIGDMLVHHSSGGKSSLRVFSYDQGARRIQGRTLDVIIIDEAPKEEVLEEMSQRTNATMGYLYLGMCPKEEDADFLVEMFEECPNKELRHVVYYGVDDATWMSPEQQQMIKDKNFGSPFYEASVNGRPISKQGMLFRLPQEEYTVAPEAAEGDSIIGLDFPHTTGPFAAVKIVRIGNIYTVVKEWKCARLTPEENAQAVLAMGGAVVPVSWPHDGGRVTGDGSTTAEVYRNLGLNMLPRPAHMIGADGKRHNSVVAIIEEVSHMLAAGTLKITSDCPALLREMSRYRFKKGTMQKRKRADDHLIDAMFKALMSKDFGAAGTAPDPLSPHDSPLANYLSSGYNLFGRNQKRRFFL